MSRIKPSPRYDSFFANRSVAYDPMYVWAQPLWGAYPGLYYPWYGFGFGPGIDIGFCFGGWGGWG